MDTSIFNDEFLRKIERLSFIAAKKRTGKLRGERITKRFGFSEEFSDYRDYQAGDDFRYIDWNIYRRSGRVMVKLFHAEEDQTVHILLDSSRSMTFGEPSKFDFARQTAAALGCIAVSSHDRLNIRSFSDSLKESLKVNVRKKYLSDILGYLSAVKPEGTTELNKALIDYAARSGPPGIIIIITDLMDEDGYTKGLAALSASRFDIILIHVLSSDETNPDRKGSFRFRDSEKGNDLRVNVTGSVIRKYQTAVAEYLRDVEDFCIRKGIEYIRVSPRVPAEDVILRYLRGGVYLR
ncbi:MAG: DUF58 domain-containing protein [Spirochaetia bacterium]